MKWKDYLKSKIFSIMIFLLVLAIIYLLLDASKLNLYVLFLTEGILILSLGGLFIKDYYKKKFYYDKLECFISRLDRKYLITEMLDQPDFIEGQILFNTLSIAAKSMNDEIGKYLLSSKEYKEYIEMWIHEVKTPIASAKLTAENNKSPVVNSLAEDIEKMEYYIEQALYYARSSAVSKDYFVKEIDLCSLVRSTIQKNSKLFIREKVVLQLDDFNYTIYSDEKWLDYIINQIIMNAIKYKDNEKDTSIVKIYTQPEKSNVSLIIEDNGIGITPADLPRVSEKGFTGISGRKYAKSTGMGLYLCRTLCDKMGLPFSIKSTLEQGTAVKITFPFK